MITYTVGTIIINILAAVLNFGGLFPVITALPLGLDNALTFFMTAIMMIIDIFPFMDIIWSLFLLGLGIKFSLFVFGWIRMLVEMVRG